MTQALAFSMDQARNQPPPFVLHPHPFIGDGRITEFAEFRVGETLGRYVERTGVSIPHCPLIVWHNGNRVSEALWTCLIPRIGDQIVIRTRALGGGGGSKVLRTVAMLALIVGTHGIGSWAGFGAALAKGTGLSLGAAQGLLMLGGTLMIAPLLPPVQPRNAK